MTRLVVRLFGSPQLERDGSPIAVDTRKALALLAYLALSGQRHGREALAVLLWPDYADGRAALRRTLSSLARALDGAGLAAERDSIALAPGAVLWVDVTHFRALLADADRHGHAAVEACPTCVARLEEAAGLYHDDFLAGFSLRDSAEFDDWRFFQAEGLRRELATVLDRLVTAHVHAGAYEPAITHARRRLALDPLHEPAHRVLMQLYEWAGQRAAALRQYQRCTRLLQDELGVAPQPETIELYQALRTGTGPQPTATVASSPTVAGSLTVAQSEPAPVVAQPTAAGQLLPLVGRETEWAILRDRYDAVGLDGHLVVVEGEAGIGKTRLVEEVLAAVGQAGAATLVVRCFAGQGGLAYGPVAEALRDALARPEAADRLSTTPPHWLAEAARLLPELAALIPDLPAALPLDNPGAQAHFFEGMAQVLSALVGGLRPGLVTVDDLHWADAATVDLLAYLIRRLRGRPLFLVATWRAEEAPAGHPLRLLLAEALRAGLGTHLTLDRLGRADVEALSTAVNPAGRALPAATVERVHTETEGLPFFLVEYLTAIAHGLTPAANGDWMRPGGIRALLRSRLTSVDDAGRRLLATAAVIGRSFDVDTLQAAGDLPEEELVVALEALLARGLIREAGGDRQPNYDFSHEHLRALVYEETSRARRRLLHRRVADALATLGAGDVDGARAGRIARHYEQAGQPAAAAQYYRLAGNYARGLYANAEALVHLRAALALGDPDSAGLHEAIGDLQTLLGDYGAAITSYTAAEGAAEPGRRVTLARKLGGVHHRRGEFARAESQYAAAEARAVASDDGERARLYSDWSLTARQQGDDIRATELAQRALTLAEASGDAPSLAQAHNALGILASGRSDLITARHHLEQSLALATDLGDRSARVAALNNLAWVAEADGRLNDALALAEAALELCVVLGDRHRAAALHSRLADLLHAASRLEPAMSHLKEAVRIYAEIGVEAGAVQPHIWRLSEW